MNYQNWQPGTAIPSPVYLDANILVGAAVTKHRLYAKTAQLLGELLASGSRILVSLLTVQESTWAIARLSWCDLAKQPANARFSQSIYQRWRKQIFQAHGTRMAAIQKTLNDWATVGVDLQVVPKNEADFLVVTARIPTYMERYRLTPADAAHLAIAEECAGSFATADSDFEDVARQSPSQSLNIVHVVP